MKKAKKKASTKKKRPGRPHIDLKDRLAARVIDYDMVTRMAETGDTDAQIAHVLGLNREITIDDWKKEDPEFAVALKKGKDIADARVVKSLYKRAEGYEYEEVHTEVSDIIDKAGQSTGLKTRKISRIKKRMAPDTTACIFWLKNRDQVNWRDRHEFVGDPTKPLIFKVVYDKERTDRKD